MTATPLKNHPAADLFPLMTGEALEALAADIQVHGLNAPIVLHDGLVLDGRNRLVACELADVEPSFVEWQGTGDPTAWVVSQNLHRRHLSESQRAMIAARLATLRDGQRKSPTQICVGALSQSEAAKLLNVGVRSIQSARTVQEHGTPELVAAVDAGEVAVSKAADIARAPAEEQPAMVEEARKPHVSRNTGEVEWYTPAKYIDIARTVMGGIDLDPASCPIANETVKATAYFTAEDDGLKQTWNGACFINPPYSQPLIVHFAEAVSSKYESGEIDQAVVLVNNATDTVWGQRLLGTCSAVCFLRGRVRFEGPDGKSGAPLQGQMLAYFGPNVEKFRSQCEAIGRVLTSTTIDSSRWLLGAKADCEL